MENQPTQASLNIVDGHPFFAHEASVNFTPTQFTVDFKCVTPRTDPRAKGKVSFQMIHNVVMMDPWHFKAVTEIMTQMLDKYEKDFGTIKKPKSIEIVEKKQKKEAVGPVPAAAQPTYFG